MSREPKDKIEITGVPRPLNTAAFAALDTLAGALPEPPVVAPIPAAPVPAKPARGRLVLRREKKDRGGKTVVVISGFADIAGMHAAAVGDLARVLRQKIGCGGSFDRREIVIQGDQPARVCELLEEMGFRVDGVRA